MKNRLMAIGGVFVVLLLLVTAWASAADITLLFPPEWKTKAPKAKEIAEALSQAASMEIKPQIAESYPDIVKAFSGSQPVIVYVGSFVQALFQARGLSKPLVQAIDGKEFYSSILIAPEGAGTDPVAIIKEAGEAVAFSRGASSGESGAKAATQGKAAIATNNHEAAVNAVKVGKAKAAFVKNWWWEANKAKFPGMSKFDYPGVSDLKNPDNILSANKAISEEAAGKITGAAIAKAKVFGVDSFTEAKTEILTPSLELMKKGGIDPKTYAW